MPNLPQHLPSLAYTPQGEGPQSVTSRGPGTSICSFAVSCDLDMLQFAGQGWNLKKKISVSLKGNLDWRLGSIPSNNFFQTFPRQVP